MTSRETIITGVLNDTIPEKKQLALLLDYDGTLSPICPHPDLALLPVETKAILERIANSKNVYCSIISGRQADNVKKMVGIDSLTYAGSHGFEIIYSDGSRYTHTVSHQDQEKMINVERDLKQEVCVDGAWVENKGEILTYHYRSVPAEKQCELVDKAREIIRRYKLNPSPAIQAIEVQPPIQWNKGYVGEYLLKNKFGENWSEQVNVIFIGDDISDEKFMELFKGRATTFRVATSEDVPTSADLRLYSLLEVITVLRWVQGRYC